MSRKIAVAFDDATFARIRRMAKREKRSFSSMADYVARCGLLCLDESDKLEREDLRQQVEALPRCAAEADEAKLIEGLNRLEARDV